MTGVCFAIRLQRQVGLARHRVFRNNLDRLQRYVSITHTLTHTYLRHQSSFILLSLIPQLMMWVCVGGPDSHCTVKKT